MTVEYECIHCGKKFHQGVDRVVEHVVDVHRGGEVKLEQVTQWIVVRAVGDEE